MPRMGRPPADTSQVSVRISNEWVERVAALAERMTLRGFKADKASVLRGALGRGLDALEAEQGISKGKGPKR